MLIEIDYKSGLPVYLQVVDQIKLLAASGSLRPGDPLPSIRPLAEQLRINRNTVARAYGELEAEGVIETIAGKGCFLKEGRSLFSRQTRLQRLTQAIDAALVEAHQSQVEAREFLGLVKARMAAFAGKRARSAGPSGAKEEER